MKTHRIRPILLKKNTESINIGDLVLPNNPNKINEGNLGIAVRSFEKNDAYSAYELILVSLEDEKIEANDKVYRHYDGGGSHIGIALPKSDELKRVKDKRAFKLIATQNQLSPELIQRLIDEYNNGGMKDFEIEMTVKDCLESHEGNTIYEPILANGFVTVVNKDSELVYFPFKVDKESITLFGAGKFKEEKLVLDKTKASLLFIELWKFLKFSKKPILYTDEDVENILIEYSRSEYVIKTQPIKFFIEYKRNKKK